MGGSPDGIGMAPTAGMGGAADGIGMAQTAEMPPTAEMGGMEGDPATGQGQQQLRPVQRGMDMTQVQGLAQPAMMATQGPPPEEAAMGPAHSQPAIMAGSQPAMMAAQGPPLGEVTMGPAGSQPAMTPHSNVVF